MRSLAALVFAFALAACGSSHATVPDAAKALEAAVPDAPPKALTCATSFGSGMTPGFGRFDGTVLAVVPPGDEMCAEPNSTHLVVQLTDATATAYRLVIDVLSDQGSPNVLFDEFDHALVGPAWTAGWNEPSSLDYVTDLGLTSTQFTAMVEGDLVTKITSELTLGARVSIYASATAAEPDSAHLVHYNAKNADGAIVIAPDTAPHFLAMRFDEDTF